MNSVLLLEAGVGVLGMGSLFLVLALTSKRKKRPNAKETATAMIEDVARSGDAEAFQWLRGAGWVVSPFALPMGAAAVVAGEVAKSANTGWKMRRTKMPESWYAQVVTDSSEEGKKFLGKCINKRGYVTVKEAARWLEIESAQHQKANPVAAAQQLADHYKQSRAI